MENNSHEPHRTPMERLQWIWECMAKGDRTTVERMADAANTTEGIAGFFLVRAAVCGLAIRIPRSPFFVKDC